MAKRKERRMFAWGGFVDGRLDYGWRLGSRDEIVPIVSVFQTRAAARKFHGDVRRVEIREVPRKAGV